MIKRSILIIVILLASITLPPISAMQTAPRTLGLVLLLSAEENPRGALVGEELLRAAAEGDVKSLKNLLATENNNIDITHKNSALFLAARNNRHIIAKILLDNKADINAQAQNGITPLIVATKEGYCNSVGLFLQYNANPSIQSRGSESALSIAIFRGYSNLLEAHKHGPYQDITSQLLTAFYKKIFLSKYLSNEEKTKFLCKLSKYIADIDVTNVPRDIQSIKELVTTNLLCLPTLVEADYKNAQYFDNFLCAYYNLANKKEELNAISTISNDF